MPLPNHLPLSPYRLSWDSFSLPPGFDKWGFLPHHPPTLVRIELQHIKAFSSSLELAPQQPSVLQLMLQSSGPFCFSAVLFDIQDKDRGAAGIFGYLFFHYLWKACELTGGSLYFYQWNCLLRHRSCLVFALHEILLSSQKSSVSPSSKPLLWFCWVLKLCFQMTTFYYLSFNKPSMLHRI